jgi:hypothetical protein
MQCAVCAALNREHNHECEAEASATIKKRAEMIGWNRGDASTNEQLEREVLRSRKRQAHIAFELYHHQTTQHPEQQIAKAAAS